MNGVYFKRECMAENKINIYFLGPHSKMRLSIRTQVLTKLLLNVDSYGTKIEYIHYNFVYKYINICIFIYILRW